DGRVCTATATRASCQPDPSVCNSLPNACALLGRSCNGDTLVDCQRDDNGCLVASETDCTANDRVCVAGNNPSCVDAPCANVTNPCSAAGTTCDGTNLVTCARDANNCLVETTIDCAANSEVCDDNSGTAMCASACMDDPRCAGQTAGETSCAGPAVQECVTNTDGCLEPELTTCAA